MEKKTHTGWLIAGVVALLAFAALVYYLLPHKVKLPRVDSEELGEALLTVLIVWLALRKSQPMKSKTRLWLGVIVAVGLLLGLAVFFIA